MKKILLVTALMIATVVNANAMSYTKARSEALFLTDKMAYELELTDYQYEAVYEINLDYFNGLIGTTDLFGINWNRRANELGYVLTSWQYRLFLETEYFYRPVIVRNKALTFVIYDRYHRDRFYKPAPRAYAHYKVGTRKYHEAPHNNKHFADHHYKKGTGHKPSGNHNHNAGHVDKPKGDKPAGHHNNGDFNKGNKPTGNHNTDKVDKPNKPTGNVDKPKTNKPSGNTNPGNVNKGNKPAGNTHGNANTNNSSVRRASKSAPERNSASKVNGGSSNGRRSK